MSEIISKAMKIDVEDGGDRQLGFTVGLAHMVDLWQHVRKDLSISDAQTVKFFDAMCEGIILRISGSEVDDAVKLGFLSQGFSVD